MPCDHSRLQDPETDAGESAYYAEELMNNALAGDDEITVHAECKSCGKMVNVTYKKERIEAMEGGDQY